MVHPAEKAGSLPIGARLKSRRKELKLTLKELAEKSGVSAPFISQAERNQTVPSMVSLLKLAAALKVDVMYFMELPHDDRILHRAEAPQYIELDSPVTYIQLSSDLPDQRMDAILMRIPPGHAFPVDQREGEDFLYLLEGELYTETGDIKTTLRAGDSLHFNSHLPHTAVNKATTEAVLLYVGTPSLFSRPK